MPQSALTVTPPSPTPPTNLSSIGLSPPDPLIYLAAVYGPPQTAPPVFDDGVANTAPVVSWNEGGGVNGTTAPAVVGDGKVFAAAHALVADSTGATSAAAEGAGTELNVTKSAGAANDFGSDWKKYGPLVSAPVPMVMVSTGPALTAASILAGPNASHASSDSTAPGSAPTITGLLPVAPVAALGYTTLTVNGTNFRPGAVVNIAGVPYPTQYNSPTQLSVQNAPKRTTAGNTAITVRVGTTTTAATNWVFS
jgi:hypothetical protein